MRKWLVIGFLIVVLIAIVAVASLPRKKQDDGAFQATLAAYRSALMPGTSRSLVEDYLRQRNKSFARSCCEPDVFSDRTKIGEEPRSWVCRNWNIYLEFKFKSVDGPTDVARGSDLLTGIDLYQDGKCL